jgi:tellurite methyltransferase
MERSILHFQKDDQQDWFATLSCGHTQHVRHQPPFLNYAWVMTEEGRESKLGAPLDCPLCDRRELPTNFVPFHRTPVFTEDSLPAGLLRDHSTKPGVWARIHVEEGHLRYHLDALGEVQDLHAGQVGIVLPELIHHVEPLSNVRFFVEFWHSPEAL